jgi:hypothetical protein
VVTEKHHQPARFLGSCDFVKPTFRAAIFNLILQRLKDIRPPAYTKYSFADQIVALHDASLLPQSDGYPAIT